MARSRRRYEDIDELVAREAERSTGARGAAATAASYATLVLCAALTIAYAVLRVLGVLAGPV